MINSLLSPRELSRIRIDTTAGTLEVDHVYGYRDADWSFFPLPSAAAAASLGRDPGVRDDSGAVPDAEPDRSADVWATSAGTDVPSNHAAQITRLVDDLLAGRTHQTTLASTRGTVEFVTARVRLRAARHPDPPGRTGAGPPVLRRPDRRDGGRRDHRPDDLTASARCCRSTGPS